MVSVRWRGAALVTAVVLGVPAVAVAASPFVDVVPGRFYEGPVSWAFSHGITTGRDATHFDPDGAVTRGESVTFLKRYHDKVVQPALDDLAASVLAGLPADSDTLGALSCATDQVAFFDGRAWRCGRATLSFELEPGTVAAVDTAGDVGSAASIAIGSDGLPVVSYFDRTNQNVKVFHCSDVTCRAGTATTLTAAGIVGSYTYTSIAVGVDGLPVVSYYDLLQGALGVFHCDDVACTSGRSTIVDIGADSGWYNSIAIGADKLPVISYYEDFGADLRVFHCSDVACTAGTTSIVDATGSVGLNSSIAIGADGLPVISYRDISRRDLKVFHCADVGCATGGTAITVDTAGDVGSAASITIGTDGLPVISYYDVTNENVKVFHCGDVACHRGTAVPIDTAGWIGATSIVIGPDGFPLIAYFSGGLRLYECADVACKAGGFMTLTTTRSISSSRSIALGVDGRPVLSVSGGPNTDLHIARLDRVATGIVFG